MSSPGRFIPGPGHREIIFLTGSGISARTGLGTFRGPDGLWALEPETEEAMHADLLPGSLPRLWSVLWRMASIALRHGPTPGHRAIARMGAQVITQNIDGLHQKAGSKRVYELHGSVWRNHCLSCGKSYSAEYIKESAGIPRCECGGIIKPDVVLYGEPLDEQTVLGAVRAIAGADLLIVAGTSLSVYPAAGFLEYFRGDHLVLINRDKTPLDGVAELVIHEKVGEVLSQL